MRLLEDREQGNLRLVEHHENIPSYAILSHTWGTDGEEVTFKDFMEGTGKDRTGYNKIEFCRKQTVSDGLQHFWVDTCCIDKSSSAELTEAINSMFRWYQGATKCYVYLSDISTSGKSTNAESSSTTWEAALQQSRWFTRGWTLQELIAPKSVEFFSSEGERIGSRESLESCIQKITGVPIRALRGDSLDDFRVDERLSWMKHRETKRQEDKAYSLLGIFNIQMPLIYGEGEGKALARLRKEIDTSDHQLLKTISNIGDAAYDSYENQRHRSCLTNTRVDILREITDWAMSDSSQYSFWLKGRAGTGKSTIALTVAQILDRPGVAMASFFFKRGGGDLARSRKVISTIAFQLAIRSPILGGLICEALRDNPNLGDSASLSQQYDKLLLRPLQKARQSAPRWTPFIVVLDALDECDDLSDVRLLLRLLGNTPDMAGLGLRLLVTSRPEIPIRLEFRNMKQFAYQEFALHDVPHVVVSQDIKTFVTHELAQIKAERSLPDSWPGDDKIQIITTHASDLFIYAATVCRYINGPWLVSPAERLQQVCQATGAKHKSTDALDGMYSIILASSMKGDFSAEEEGHLTTRLRKVVGSVVLLFDSMSAEQLAKLLFPNVLIGELLVQQTLDPLHAVFDVPEDLSRPIQMLHLSFRDFLVDNTRCPDIRFQICPQQVHLDLSNHCLALMEQSLTQNICRLSGPGTLVDEISETILKQNLPFALRYACCHWVSHTEHSRIVLSDYGPVHGFLKRGSLYWLEVMSLISKIPEAISTITQLKGLIDPSEAPELYLLVQDILRFMLAFTHMLVKAPIQVYNAGLIFSPTHCVFRNSFSSQASADCEVETALPLTWNACAQTLEGHSQWVNSVVFAPDGSRLASGSRDNTIRVWNVQTGHCQHILEGHSDDIESVAFSPDGLRVASGSWDKTVRVWNVQTGQCQCTLKGHSSIVRDIAYSPDGSHLASGSDDGMVRVWDVQTGHCRHALGGHSFIITSIVFSSNGSQVASGSWDRTVRVWDVQTGQCQHTLECNSGGVESVTFSPDGSQLASGSNDNTVRVWDVRTGQCQYTLEGHSDRYINVIFSPDGSRVASGSYDKTVRLWDVRTGQCQHTLRGHLGVVWSVAFSPDGSRLASGSDDKTVRIWDVQTGQCQDVLEGHSHRVTSVIFSSGGSRVASGSYDKTVRVWDVQKRYQYTRKGHSDWINSLVFSPDGSRVISGSYDNSMRVWDVQTGKCQHVLQGHSSRNIKAIFSPDGSQIVSRSDDETMRIWDVKTGLCQRILKGHSKLVISVVFSLDGSRVASCSHDETIRVWDVRTGQCQHILQGHRGIFWSMVFSPDGSRLASGSDEKTVRIWDVQTGQCQHVLEGHSGWVSSVIFSCDGSQIASGSHDMILRVWNMQTGQCQHMLKGHSRAVEKVAFSPDGSRIVSGSDDGSMRVWDLHTGHHQYILDDRSGGVSSLVFSPDGSRIASGSRDGIMRVWDVISLTELLRCDVGKGHQNITFSSDSSEILVNGNSLSLSPQTQTFSTTAEPHISHRILSINQIEFQGEWVTAASKRILWIPPEYRPNHWVSQKDTIVLGSATGRVSFVRCAATLSLS